jgi:hypothetical protein
MELLIGSFLHRFCSGLKRPVGVIQLCHADLDRLNSPLVFTSSTAVRIAITWKLKVVKDVEIKNEELNIRIKD